MDNRQFPRFAFREAVGYHRNEGLPVEGSVGADISRGGVRIRVHQFIPLRSVVYLKIHLTNPVRTLPVKGTVVWIREVPHSEAFDVGIQFVEVNASELKF